MSEALRILIAEDEADDVTLLQRAFSKADTQAPVRFVRDGQEAIDYLQGVPPFEDRDAHPLPTMLVIDLKMPRMDGFEVLEWLRRHTELARPFIVVLTSSEQPGDVHRAYSLGADSYHVKPVEPDELVHMVGRIQEYWREKFVPRNPVPARESKPLGQNGFQSGEARAG